MKASIIRSLLWLISCGQLALAQYGSPKYPLPTFDKPTHIPFESTRLAFWGENDATGYASDWIYVSNDKIHQLLFQMPQGASYHSSEKTPVIYGADEVWCVLGGTLVINNPENGEVHVVNKGDAVFFRKDTWHHGYNYGKEPLRVLEFFAPPPAAGTTGAYSTSKPYLKKFKESQDEWIGRWPMAEADVKRAFTLKVMSDSSLLWRREGQALIGLYAATEHLTAGKMILLPGQKGELHTHAGDESLYLLEGSLNVNTPASEGQQSFILKPQDGFYIPKGAAHQLFNMSDQPVTVLFGVAPKYGPEKK